MALQLLGNNSVERIGLVDADPMVASFWRVVFFDSEWLCDQIENIDVSVSSWKRMRSASHDGDREKALACLFLNRTSFSGILALTAGPIGGKEQKSDYKIDCRFPRNTLVRRVRTAASFKDRVDFVWGLSWKRAMSRIAKMRKNGGLSDDVFFYFDPPFFKKADRLYRFYFEDKDHVDLRDHIIAMKDPWILSYDYDPMVEELYSESRPVNHVDLLYNTPNSGNHLVAKEAVVSNLRRLPSRQETWITLAGQTSGDGQVGQEPELVARVNEGGSAATPVPK